MIKYIAVLDEEEEGVKELMPNWSASYQFGRPGRYMFITNLQYEQDAELDHKRKHAVKIVPYTEYGS
jgi:hypothetical protein